MNTTARILCGWIAVALGLTTALALAQPAPQPPAPGGPGTAARPSTGDKRLVADDLLRRARQAMDQNDLQAAAQLIDQAEAMGVEYHPLYTGDSPKKARRDLERRLQANSVGRPGTPNPFGPRGVTPLPPVDQAMPMAQPAPQQGGNAGNANGMLLEGRRALAVGDARRAAMLAQQAKATGVAFGPGDNPDKLQATIAGYNDLMAQRNERGNTESWRRQLAKLLMEQADSLLRWQEYDEAERLATEAARLRVQFTPYEPRPEQLLEHIANLRRQGQVPARAPSGVMPAGGEYVGPPGQYDRGAAPAVYDPGNDPTRNVPAGDQQPEPSLGVRFPQGPAAPQPGMQPGGPPPGAAMPAGQPGMGMSLFQQGEAALKARDTQAALDLFRQAYAHIDELDPVSARRLTDYLQLLPQTAVARQTPTAPLDEAAARQQVLTKQMAAEVAQALSTSRKALETDAKAAAGILEKAKERVAQSGLEPQVRDRMTRQLDRELADVQKYIEEHRHQIALDERNQKIRDDNDRRRNGQFDTQQKLAQKVEEFNNLMREQRYAEAEVVAKQAAELDPDSPLAQQIVLNAKLVRRMSDNRQLRDNKEQAVMDTLAEVDRAAVPFSGATPYVFPDATEWRNLSNRRARLNESAMRRRSEKETEILRKLKTPVSVQFENAPLSKVMNYLAQLAEVNLYLDPQGLAEEGVTTDTPVSIDLRHEVKLESALNLILQPLHLSYVVRDEVLKVTSEQARNSDRVTVTYNVADLVIPIPNFAPNHGLGLERAYQNAMVSANNGAGGAMPFGSSAVTPMSVIASKDGHASSRPLDSAVLAQMSGGARPGAGGAAPANVPIGGGPGGAGGGPQPDFDSLIDLITSTIQPNTWDDVGGAGSIAPFEPNLSLVVSQTQEVHEQIVDLLEQLRRMQDLQVTIEVRFITLNDNFFERIGVDFDFDVRDGIGHPGQVFGRMTAVGPPTTYDTTIDPAIDPSSYTVGRSSPDAYTSDLDIQVRQNSFSLAVPQFGGFDAGAGTQFGFAILSEIEAFFFVNAAQGDRRSNVLQAPKVTLFNGQQAFVSDTSQSPFVISVIPVVGDFAAAQQPVIVVLNEGTFLTVQAVVSNDRRFVRLTVVPFFSQIEKVNTFQFVGSETTVSDTSQEGNQTTPTNATKKNNKKETRREGTTVQLPTFSYITVTTTVSVPDGGTVLLGGIKRLSEGRNEFGTPILNKIPYINRLFKNVGIGRETQSLMMMVTPRIIIQEEEEERLGIQPQQ